MSSVQARNKEQVLCQSIADALDLLDDFCGRPGCSGCLHEHGDVENLLIVALAIAREEQCPRCDGEPFLPFPPQHDDFEVFCSLCKASGTRVGFVAVRPDRERHPSAPFAEGVEDALQVLTRAGPEDPEEMRRNRDKAQTMLEVLLHSTSKS